VEKNLRPWWGGTIVEGAGWGRGGAQIKLWDLERGKRGGPRSTWMKVMEQGEHWLAG